MGKVFNIQRYCLHDGPGIRTTVFFKGCMLKCAWCHNPESQRLQEELICRIVKCVNCGKCATVCPNECHTYENGTHKFDFSNCVLCGKCVSECPASALEIMGKDYTADEVIAEVVRDKIFYNTSGGGVTISGGEPFFQPEFLIEILAKCKKQGLHTAIETSGCTSEENIRKAAEYCDLFLYDFKLSDSDKHKEYTGVDNEKIIGNLKLLNSIGKKVWLRLPIIPLVNDNDFHFEEVAKIVNACDNIEKVQIEPYHKLGEAKYTGLGKDILYSSEAPSPEIVCQWIETLKKLCPDTTVEENK